MRQKTIESAVMFADISDSTRLYESLGDGRAQSIISQCLTRMISICDRQSGILIKTVGDEIMYCFPTVNEAVLAAQTINQALESEISSEGVKLSVRIGMHFGKVVEKERDLYGDVVNVAARLTSIARAQQIITTQAVIDRLSEGFNNGVRLYDQAAIRGKQEEIKMYEILWGQEDVTGIISQVDLARHTGFSVLVLKYEDQKYVVKPSNNPMLIGRGKQCQLIVNTLLASRKHARLEYHRGKFVLVDQSTNGTFVKSQEGGEVYLRREELPLFGDGLISLGESIADNPGKLIHFHCQ
ncbi:MAG: adenylate/guanylate cyclase domain-containing protein [Gammaproteobacteria bacterium]|nr:adenylate/guanylate cyclase domain-containing protein [Gammaproteobacteria bacterium]